MPPLVSVIVPTRNSADTLGRCLESIRKQTYEPLELVVVDNGSTDGTLDIARTHSDVVIDAGPERSAQRNAGAANASGDRLFFIDSDMILAPNVVSECVALAEQGAAGVVVPEVSFGVGFWANCKRLERSCYLGDETIEAARFFTRESFEGCGGYDEDIPAGPEDWDMHERVRASTNRISRTQSVIQHDEGELRLRELLARKYYYGKSTQAYINKHGGLARRQLRLVRPAFIRHWRALAKEPLTAAGVVFMKFCELSAGAAGLIAARLRGTSTHRTARPQPR